MVGYRTSLTGSSHMPWSTSSSARRLSDGSSLAADCAHLTDKRRSWCMAGWTRMDHNLDEKLLQSGWGSEWNIFYACEQRAALNRLPTTAGPAAVAQALLPCTA